MSSGFTDRDFGRLEAEVEALREQNGRLEKQISALNAKVDVLVEAITEAKGGWKVLFAIGTASAAVGASVVKIIAFLKGG